MSNTYPGNVYKFDGFKNAVGEKDRLNTIVLGKENKEIDEKLMK